MAVAVKFTCPDDGEEFGTLWKFNQPVICPKCSKVWPTELILDENEMVTGARIATTVDS